MTKTSNDKEFRKAIISLIVPMTLQNFMFALIPVSDTAMLVSLDQDAMSAVSLAAQMSFIMSLFVSALVSGLSIFAAQYWGKKDMKGIETSFGYVMRITLPVLMALWAMAFIFPEGVMRIFTSEPAIIKHGIVYLRIVAFSSFLRRSCPIFRFRFLERLSHSVFSVCMMDLFILLCPFLSRCSASVRTERSCLSAAE